MNIDRFKFFILLTITLTLMFSFSLAFVKIPSDEYVYYYMAKKVREGYLPYTDFEYAHPPLQLVIYQIVDSVLSIKTLTWLINLGIFSMVYLIAKERYGEKPALVSAMLFALTFDMFLFGAVAWGTEIALLFILISFYCVDKYPLFSGLSTSLSILTRLHFLPIVVVIMGMCICNYICNRENKKLIKFTIGLSSTIFFYSLMSGARPFYENVFLYHIQKPMLWSGFVNWLQATGFFIVLFISSLPYIKAKRKKGFKHPIDTIIMGIVYVLFLFFMKSIFEYYLVLLTVIVCINCSMAFKTNLGRIFKIALILWIFLLYSKYTLLWEEDREYSRIIAEVKALEKNEIVGSGNMASFLALYTGKEIKNLQIDTNMQRGKIYNYSNAIVVYEKKRFFGEGFNCSLTNVSSKKYEIWLCP